MVSKAAAAISRLKKTMEDHELKKEAHREEAEMRRKEEKRQRRG